MSDVKVTDLPSLSSADSNDVLVIVEVDADITKKISKQDLLSGLSGGSSNLQNIADSADGVVVSGDLKIGDISISSSGTAPGNTVMRADNTGNIGIGLTDSSSISSRLEVGGTGVTTTHLETSQIVIFNNLPSSDPALAGQIWNDAGVLKISAG